MNSVEFRYEVCQVSDVFGASVIAGFIDEYDADRFVHAQTKTWGGNGLTFERRRAVVGSTPEGNKE